MTDENPAMAAAEQLAAHTTAIDCIPHSFDEFRALQTTRLQIRDGRVITVDTMREATAIDAILEPYQGQTNWPEAVVEYLKGAPWEIPDATWGEAVYIADSVCERSARLKKTFRQPESSRGSTG
jgi:hypothetical protein